MGDKMNYVCHIEELIKKSGLRKDFICKKIGTTTRQLRNYEKMELFIPMEKGLLLAELLNCKVDDFYERKVD
ncbi:helix-turn-helix transcriptional regulator [Neobacillus sp. 3P2-tot-E-2]|uniref:helix-turn-helix domain-containing protein n=1 Tax=Neobacillus sp. 3P2-tot-E-2 TaxID=3132212 RepID=UPI0039A2B266